MLWLKAFHIIFIVTWFAGMFYLPRLFVYHCDVTDAAGHTRFCTMERKLYGITTLGMLGSWVLGIAMLVAAPAFLKSGAWIYVKLLLVFALSGYHGWLKTRLRAFAGKRNTHSARFYRVANEVPALFLVAIVLLVVLKPF